MESTDAGTPSRASTPPSWDLTRIVLGVAAIGGLVATSFWILRPFLPSLVWATMIVVATWPGLLMIQARLGGRRGLAVAVMTLIMLVIVVVPVAVGVMAVVEHADTIVTWSRSFVEQALPVLPARLRKVPLIGERLADKWTQIASLRPEEMAAHVSPYLTSVARWILGQAGGLGTLFIQLLLTVALSAILYVNGETVAGRVLAFARRLAGDAGERVAILSAQAIRAVALGIVVTALVQAVVGGIGLAVTGVPYPVLLSAVMFLLGVAQIGPLPVLVGAIAWLFWKDQALWATVMIVFTVITATLDNFLRPLLIRRGADLPLLLIFAGVLGGLLAFGVVGLFIGPVVLAVTYTLLQAWVESPTAAPGPQAPDGR